MGFDCHGDNVSFLLLQRSEWPLTPPNPSPKSVAVMCITFLPVYIVPLCQTPPAAFHTCPVTSSERKLWYIFGTERPLCLRVWWEGSLILRHSHKFEKIACTQRLSWEMAHTYSNRNTVRHALQAVKPSEQLWSWWMCLSTERKIPVLYGVINEDEVRGRSSSVRWKADMRDVSAILLRFIHIQLQKPYICTQVTSLKRS